MMNEELKHISIWRDTNKLVLNVKVHDIVFHWLCRKDKQ